MITARQAKEMGKGAKEREARIRKETKEKLYAELEAEIKKEAPTGKEKTYIRLRSKMEIEAGQEMVDELIKTYGYLASVEELGTYTRLAVAW